MTARSQSTAPRAAIYVRVSTAHQEDGTSLTTQEEQCREYAVANGYTVAEEHVYREVYSGMELWDRPQLTALREAIRAEQINAVIAFSIDRLTRDPVHLGLIITEADHRAVDVTFVTESLDNSSEGELIRFVRGYAAKIEHEKIRERAMRGKKARVQSGRLLAGPRPLYGYCWENARHERLLIHPETSRVVQRIFEEVVSGKPLRRIAIDLSNDGIPTPTGRSASWSHTAVAGILKHPNYTGTASAWAWRELGDKTTKVFDHAHAIPLPDGTVPALVDQSMWDAVQAVLRRNQERARLNLSRAPVKDALLWGGFVRCGYCGRAMTIRRGKGREPQYGCTGRGDPVHPCTGHTIRTTTFDTAVWRRVQDVLTNPMIIAREVERLRDNDPTEQELGIIDRARDDIMRRQRNLTHVVATLDDLDAAAPLVAELQSLGDRLRTVERERQELLTRQAMWQTTQTQLDALGSWCGTVAGNLEGLGTEERRLALDALGVEARLYRSEHDPRYVITMALPVEEPIHVQNSSVFLQLVHVGWT